MTNEEAGRALDAAERDLRDARVLLDYCERHPECEQAKMGLHFLIPKAALMPGGMALQKAVNDQLAQSEMMDHFIERAMQALEADARKRASDALDAVNAQRMRLNLPPVGDLDDRMSAEMDAAEKPGGETSGGGPFTDNSRQSTTPPPPIARGNRRRPAQSQESAT